MSHKSEEGALVKVRQKTEGHTGQICLLVISGAHWLICVMGLRTRKMEGARWSRWVIELRKKRARGHAGQDEREERARG